MPSVAETTVSIGAPAPAKAPKAPKSKKVSSALEKPPVYPPYLEMIKEAIVALKERTGSSQYAIAKHIEEKQSLHLPPHFKKLLLVQLKKFVASGKLVKVKNSFKLPAKSLATDAPKKLAPAKPKVKPVKISKVVAKPKPKPKAKPAKAAKSAVTVMSPAKKAPAKVVRKPKTVKSPAKKVASKKGKK